MKHRILPAITASILFFVPALAHADEPSKPMFSFSGYGTAGLSHTTENQADFTSNVLKASGVGSSGNWSGDVDSRFGVQLTANFSPQFSGVLQLTSEQRYDKTYRPTIEWANLKYQVTPNLSARAGRIALPTFLAADYRKVGYVLPWARTPVELYNLIPITNSDGVDFTYRLHVGDWTNVIQGSVGTTSIQYSQGTATATAIRGFSSTTEYGAFTARLSYVQGDLSLGLAKPLFDGFRQFGPQGAAIADQYDIDNKRVSVVGLGASYDPGEWFAMGELGRGTTNSFLGAKSAWYLSAGYRFGKISPYLVVGQVWADSNVSDPGLSVTGLPPQLAGLASGLNGGLNALLGAIGEQRSIAVGSRWDLVKNGAIKLQYDRITLGAGSLGNLVLEQPGFRRGGTVNVVSAVFDFVF